MIEIGPGHGAITSILAARCRRLIAIELDPALAAELRFRFRAQPQVEIVKADVLEVDLAALVPPGESADVVGNCPTTSPRRSCCASSPPEREACWRGRADDAARGGGPAERRARLPRVRAALGNDAELRACGEAVYAAAGRLLAAAGGFFDGAAAGVCATLRGARRGRRGLDAFLHRCFAQKRRRWRTTCAPPGKAEARGYSTEELRAAWPAEIPPLARAESLGLEELAALHRALAPLRQNEE